MATIYSRIFTKQPSEIYPISVDYSDVLDTGETISSESVTATDSAGTDVTATLIDSTEISGSTIKAVIKAGTTGNKYKLTFKATTSDSNLYEDDITMRVVEI